VPGWVTRWFLRTRASLSARHDRELRDELQLHLTLLEEEYAAQGISPEMARRRAHREFGNATLFQEASHDLFSFRLLEDLVQDLRYAARELRRSVGFTCVAVASLAIGIGAITTAFTVVDAFMLRGLPVRDPERLVALSSASSSTWGSWTYTMFSLWRDSSDGLFEVAASFDLDSSAIVPANSRAKFESDVSDGVFNTKQIYFNYYWVNPFDKYVVFNVSGYGVVYGTGQIEAYGGVILGESFARVFCTAQLNVEDWTTDSFVPLGFPLIQGLFDDGEDQSGFLQSSATSLPTWSRGCDLQYPSVVIQPGGVVGIGVTISLQSETEKGLVYADFSSGDHRVSSPGVLVTVVS